MNPTGLISTWDLLQEFGFMPDASVGFSDVMPGLSFDFGNFKLKASCVMNLHFVEVVMFTGYVTTPRTMTELLFELPRQVESREQCAAWIAWNLKGDVPKHEPDWLKEGRLHFNLLPWERRRAAYEARPHCSVSRKWARLALDTLATHLTTVPDAALVEFVFDGAVLTIRCEGKVVALPGDGSSWQHTYLIRAEKLRHLPQRLMRDPLEVSVFDGALTLENRRYEGVIPV
ncbi:MAG: hypothetical protein WCH84_08275 [Verrucomicrobiota bacterium]